MADPEQTNSITFTQGGNTIGGGGGGTSSNVVKTSKAVELEACVAFLQALGLDSIPDAVEQLQEVFVPCLEIMCTRGWHPEGETWRKSGVLGILGDVRKKFERLWERGWIRGIRHDDSGYDLINYVGMYLRSEDNGWGDWGEPGDRRKENQ